MYYRATQRFVAYCNHPDHERCSRERADWEGRRPSQGRPLGLLVAWLEASHNYASKAEHCEFGVHLDLGRRQAARQALQERGLGGELGAARLLSMERPRRAEEVDEPEVPP